MSRDEPAVATVGLVEKRGKFLTAVPFFERGRSMTIEADPRRIKPGDLVLLTPPAKGRGRARARRIGRPDVARDVIEAHMLDRGLQRRFDPQVDHAAREPQAVHHPRRDLRDLATFTIDPTTARDFDDAISARESGPGRWRIWVHIADVSAFVAPGSPLDREAHRRATSVYVPGAVEPMLPEGLSNRACSLVPGEDRLVVTAEIDLEGAKAVRAAFYRAVIRSDERLDYERVDRIFAGTEEARDPWATPLAAARDAAGALADRRERQGALEVESSEPEFEFDAQGHVTAVSGSVQTESHRLIEHLMILANEQVATVLEEHHIPTLYRVHEKPDAPRVERLVAQLASLEVPTPPVPEHLTPQQAADLVGEISRTVAEHVRRTGYGRAAFTSLVLRSLKQAIYSPQNAGHAGLHSPRYCHFTSPIRRYPDLIAHRGLLSAVGGGEQAPPASRMEELGAWTSTRERDAMIIERDADDIARAFVLEKHLFEHGFETEFKGEVVGLIGAGAFVAFGDGYEGMLPVRRLRGDWWELNEEGTILHGTRSGGVLRLGDPVRVTVGRVDTPRGRVDLHPVEMGA